VALLILTVGDGNYKFCHYDRFKKLNAGKVFLKILYPCEIKLLYLPNTAITISILIPESSILLFLCEIFILTKEMSLVILLYYNLLYIQLYPIIFTSN
jgi:hypothetical protein